MPAYNEHFQTVQIPPGGGNFFPGAIFLDLMIAFSKE
jgi:hypothetical protein